MNVPRDTDLSGGKANVQSKVLNKRGYSDLILATKDTSLTMVVNAKTDALPKGDLHLWDPSQERTKLTLLLNSFSSRWKTSKCNPRLNGTYGKKDEQAGKFWP